jgi:hypothetical protein
MTNLQNLANLAEILSALFVVGGVIFAIVQIRQMQYQREEAVAIELFRAWQDPQFSRAFHALSMLSKDEILDHSNKEKKFGSDAFVVFNFLESVGVMVNRKILPSDVAFDLIGGVTMTLWPKFEPWVLFSRTASNPRAYEWAEWLYNDFANQTKKLEST